MPPRQKKKRNAKKKKKDAEKQAEGSTNDRVVEEGQENEKGSGNEDEEMVPKTPTKNREDGELKSSDGEIEDGRLNGESKQDNEGVGCSSDIHLENLEKSTEIMIAEASIQDREVSVPETGEPLVEQNGHGFLVDTNGSLGETQTLPEQNEYEIPIDDVEASEENCIGDNLQDSRRGYGSLGETQTLPEQNVHEIPIDDVEASEENCIGDDLQDSRRGYGSVSSTSSESEESYSIEIRDGNSKDSNWASRDNGENKPSDGWERQDYSDQGLSWSLKDDNERSKESDSRTSTWVASPDEGKHSSEVEETEVVEERKHLNELEAAECSLEPQAETSDVKKEDAIANDIQGALKADEKQYAEASLQVPSDRISETQDSELSKENLEHIVFDSNAEAQTDNSGMALSSEGDKGLQENYNKEQYTTMEMLPKSLTGAGNSEDILESRIGINCLSQPPESVANQVADVQQAPASEASDFGKLAANVSSEVTNSVFGQTQKDYTAIQEPKSGEIQEPVAKESTEILVLAHSPSKDLSTDDALFTEDIRSQLSETSDGQESSKIDDLSCRAVVDLNESVQSVGSVDTPRSVQSFSFQYDRADFPSQDNEEVPWQEASSEDSHYQYKRQNSDYKEDNQQLAYEEPPNENIDDRQVLTSEEADGSAGPRATVPNELNNGTKIETEDLGVNSASDGKIKDSQSDVVVNLTQHEIVSPSISEERVDPLKNEDELSLKDMNPNFIQSSEHGLLVSHDIVQSISRQHKSSDKSLVIPENTEAESAPLMKQRTSLMSCCGVFDILKAFRG